MVGAISRTRRWRRGRVRWWLSIFMRIHVLNRFELLEQRVYYLTTLRAASRINRKERKEHKEFEEFRDFSTFFAANSLILQAAPKE